MAARCNQIKTIGIVGGLGPFAHIEFEKKLLEASLALVGAKKDQDYPEWLLSSITKTPIRNGSNRNGLDSPVPMIVRGLKQLESAYDENGCVISRADFAVLVCNSAHIYFSDIQAQTELPILNMVELTTRFISKIHPQAKVGILATTGTLDSRIYHDSLLRYGLMPLSPLDLSNGETQQKLIMDTIFGNQENPLLRKHGIKEGRIYDHHVKDLTDIANQMKEQLSADVFIAGCTELPIAISGAEIAGIPLLDPMAIVAEASINIAYGLKPWSYYT